MSANWTYFFGAAILGGCFAMFAGAPPVAVLLGIGLAAPVSRWISRSFN